MKRFFPFAAMFFLVSMTSCQTLFKKMYGFNELQSFDTTMYVDFIKSFPSDFYFTPIVGTGEQSRQVSQFDTVNSWYRQQMMQPCQIIYFKGDSLVSFHANCLAPAKGFNLNWKYDHRFETFPPKSALAIDSMYVSLSDYRSVYPEISENDDYTILIYWTNVLQKVSRSAIMTAFENCKQFKQMQKCRFYFINSDKFLIEAMKE